MFQYEDGVTIPLLYHLNSEPWLNLDAYAAVSAEVPFPARVAAIIQGSSETTLYVLAVYFGSVGIRKERHALACGLFADLVAVVVAILLAYWFYH